MSHVSHRLNGALEGALAGGGDPATSPLYVFGPYLRLLAAGSVGAICFGAPIWMVVATVVVVGLMYKRVMEWVPDGSGGSGLCDEEFGGWAVKVNASITVIEYTLTFLVSIAALVTFIADRLGGLGHWNRVLLAIGLSVGVGFVVNRGPRLAARVFGPATAAVLILLWALVTATIFRHGLVLPNFDLRAFAAENLQTTLAGYVRLLALMTGIEVFANLVAAYEGSPAKRARKAFASMIIVMATTLTTMVVVGPAIHALADPARQDVSVFTQTMDKLLPAPLAYAGTLIGIVVLLSAAAAAAQGLQNLTLGMRHRHYVPASFGQRNRHDVADHPVVLQTLVVAACFLAFGTHEETYLSLYAAGVFVLLGLTGWASVKRLVRESRLGNSGWPSVAGAFAAAFVTSMAAILIFVERFTEGAWAYFLLVPMIYAAFSWYRRRLGPPTPLDERLGRLLVERKSLLTVPGEQWPERIGVVADGTDHIEISLIAGARLGQILDCPVSLYVVDGRLDTNFLAALRSAFSWESPPVMAPDYLSACRAARQNGANLLVVSRESSDLKVLVRETETAILAISADSPSATRYTNLSRVLVGLDGSMEAEALLPVVARLLHANAHVKLVAVLDGDAPSDLLSDYMAGISRDLGRLGRLETFVGGSGPARTLVEESKNFQADLVVVASHGRGGVHRSASIPLGSVPEKLLVELPCPLLIIPAKVANS